MKLIKSIALCALFVLALSCDNDATNKVKGERLKLTLTKSKVLMNESITVKIGHDTSIDSIHFVNYKPIKREGNASAEFTFNKPGTYRIEVLGINSASDQKKKGFVQVQVVSGITPQKLEFEIVETVDHNTGYYTQGLEINSDHLYESTGQYGQSKLIKYNYPALTIDRSIELEKDYFAEGITVVGDSIYQLTWQENVCFIYDHNLEKIGQLPLPSPEGWGLAHDASDQLFLSDGTGNIYTTDKSLSVTEISQVYFGERAIKSLNELEYVDGKVWANVYGADQIVRINPKTGVIDAFVDFAMLRLRINNSEAEVLNGIAYDAQKDAFWITGKNWEKMFLIKLIP
ncbi:MAG: glutaminyl-peptide cyclotransferase [Schleiferiaceae bacterium]|nr:glutaminyl-peptide cyclotransferase [Schleiferiaceae bacterium]